MNTINNTAGVTRGFQWQDSGHLRWNFETDANDDLQVYAYAPTTGAYQGNPLGFSTTNQQTKYGWQLYGAVSSSTIAAGGILGRLETWTNTSGNNAYGAKATNFSNSVAAGFDLGNATFEIATATSGFPTGGGGTSAFQSQWTVAMSPNASSGNWNTVGSEIDVVNRGADRGWSNAATQANATGGLLVVPESNLFGQGGTAYPALFGVDVRASAANGAAGYPNPFYNGFTCDPNAIAGATGRCFYANGDISGTAGRYPYSPFGSQGNWLHGIDTTQDVFTDGAAFEAAPGQIIGFVSSGTFAGISSTGTGASVATTVLGDGAVQFEAGTTSGANVPIILAGGVTSTSNAKISTGSNINLVLQSAGQINLAAASVTQITAANASVTFGVPTILKSYTVSTLPTCNAGLQGGMAYVTDATSPTYNAALTGSGAVIVPVFCNGTAWTSH